MATKEENLKRLCELAERLGREPDVSGSAADIAQRVAWRKSLEMRGRSQSRIRTHHRKMIRPRIKASQFLNSQALLPETKRGRLRWWHWRHCIQNVMVQ